MTPFILAESRDPWEPYHTESNGKGKGKGKGHDFPVVPEPSSYGAFFIGFCMLWVFVVKWRKMRESRKEC